MNSQLNFRLVISTLQFLGHDLVFLSAKPAAGHIEISGLLGGVLITILNVKKTNRVADFALAAEPQLGLMTRERTSREAAVSRNLNVWLLKLPSCTAGSDWKLDAMAFSVGTGGLTKVQVDGFLPQGDRRGALVVTGLLLAMLTAVFWFFFEIAS